MDDLCSYCGTKSRELRWSVQGSENLCSAGCADIMGREWEKENDRFAIIRKDGRVWKDQW